MDRTLLNLALLDLQKNSKIELFSKDYFFNKKHAKDRSQVVMLGAAQHRTRLSLLIREGMNEEHRRALFPGDYDLGNMRSLLPQFCKLASDSRKLDKDTLDKGTLAGELNRDLWREGRLPASQLITRDHLKKIQRRIENLTGRTMEKHYACNKSTAFKVVKLLCWLNKASIEGDSSSRPQLIASLKWPLNEKDYSLSFRDAYPYQENQEQVWLISDLKSYLSAELDDETHEQIGALQAFLHERIDNTERNVTRALNRLSYADQVQAYQDLANEVKKFEARPQLADVPLDQDFYFYLNALEFAHFATGHLDLLEKAKARVEMMPVFSAIDRLAKDMKQNGLVNLHVPALSSEQISELMQRHIAMLCSLVGKAMGKEISAPELKRTIPQVVNLLDMYAMVRKQRLLGNKNTAIVTTLEWVAAICCVHDELSKDARERTKLKPYWRGQGDQGDSILPALKKSAVIQKSQADPVPEEHRYIWVNRLEWCMGCLQGHAELKAQQFAFRAVLVEKVKDISKTNNLACVHRSLRQLSLTVEGAISKFLKKGPM